MVSAQGSGKGRTLDSTVVQEFAYVYNGGTLMQMVIETTVDDGAPVTETLSFSYDASGKPMNVIYNGTAYFYAVNLQGDVMAILDTDGEIVVSYDYDAWGNIRSVTGTMADTLGESNPLTYRSYVYDHETGLYYVSSRYYDPEIDRFINADVLVSTGQGMLGNNMFAYCRNNPVCRKDITGTTDVALLEDGTNLLNEEKCFDGAQINNGGSSYISGEGLPGKGFDTYGQLKKEIGSPGEGNEWHHIVEQSQIVKSGFNPQQVQNTDNVIAVSQTSHRAISGYYSSIQPFTNGLTVRNWLAGQSFSEQYRFGMNVVSTYM